MVRDALRGYLSLASGLSEVTAGRARAAARALVEQGEATAGQVSSLAEDLVSTSRRNRESIVVLVRHVVEQAIRRVGLASASDNDELTRRVRQLERRIRELQAQLDKPASGAKAGTSASSGSRGKGGRKTAASGSGRAS
jgi:polyhydroxyalkanoate synthesis regulator phasin